MSKAIGQLDGRYLAILFLSGDGVGMTINDSKHDGYYRYCKLYAAIETMSSDLEFELMPFRHALRGIGAGSLGSSLGSTLA